MISKSARSAGYKIQYYNVFFLIKESIPAKAEDGSPLLDL